MSIKNISNTSYTNPLIGIQSDPPTVGSTATPEEEAAPLVGVQDEETGTVETSADGLVPPPDPEEDPLGYAAWVENEYKPYLESKEQALQEIQNQIKAKEDEIKAKEDEIELKEDAIKAKEDLIEEKTEQIEDLEKLKQELESLAENSDEGAQALIDSIDAEIEKRSDDIDVLSDEIEDLQDDIEDCQESIEDLQKDIEDLEAAQEEPLVDEETEAFADENEVYTANGDFDGDGQKNSIDVDDDNDGLLDDGEINNYNTNPFSNDSDGDGLNDFAEVKLMPKDQAYAGLADANNADANHNNVIDGKEVAAAKSGTWGVGTAPASGSGSGGGTGGTDGGTPGVGATSGDVSWNIPSEGAHESNFSANATFAKDGEDVVITLTGDITAEMDGNDLILTDKNSGKKVTIKDYLGEDGKPQRKVYLQGEGQITYKNMDPSLFTATVGEDGYATGGVNIASDSDIETNSEIFYDPMGGNVAILEDESSATEVVYNAGGSSGVFTLPEDFKTAEVSLDGTDVIITAHKPDGTEVTFRLKNAKSRFENFNITIKLSETGDGIGQKIDSEVKAKIIGSNGKDMILGFGILEGGKGNDYIAAKHASTIKGGDGDDFLEGSQETDTIQGGKGMDFLYSGAYDAENPELGANDDTLDGGDDSDTLIVGDGSTQSNYHVKGGGGVDISNFTGANKEDNLEINQLNNLNGLVDALEEQLEGTSGAQADELGKALGIAKASQSGAANTVEDGALAILMAKRGEFDGFYGIDHEGGADIPGPSGDDEEEES